MLASVIWKEKTRIIFYGTVTKLKLDKLLLKRPNSQIIPKSSEVLQNQLKQRNFPHWTAW